MKAIIIQVASYLPEYILTNDELAYNVSRVECG